MRPASHEPAPLGRGRADQAWRTASATRDRSTTIVSRPGRAPRHRPAGDPARAKSAGRPTPSPGTETPDRRCGPGPGPTAGPAASPRPAGSPAAPAPGPGPPPRALRAPVPVSDPPDPPPVIPAPVAQIVPAGRIGTHGPVGHLVRVVARPRQELLGQQVL